MKPLRLIIKDFMCYDESVINFNFQSALIVGRATNNDLHSNGVGKSTIFKAIEYALFNEVGTNLEKIIRDDTQKCKVIFDFELDSIYRVIRSRNKKGINDLSLFVRNSVDEDEYTFLEDTNDKYWKSLTCRRVSDTEKELNKVIKINYDSFRNTVHFAQNDFSGLTTITPSKRKTLLKETLNLSIYSKLEKIAKEQLSANKNSIQSQEFKLLSLKESVSKKDNVILSLATLDSIVNDLTNKIDISKKIINDNTNIISLLKEEKFKSQSNLDAFLKTKESLSNYIKILSNKNSFLNEEKKNLLLKGKNLSNSINSLKTFLNENKPIELSLIQTDINSCNLNQFKLTEKISSNDQEIKKLKKPLPKETVCSTCLQSISEEHKDSCLKLNNEKISFLEEQNSKFKNELLSLKKNLNDLTTKLKASEEKNDNITSCNLKLSKLEFEIQSERDKLKKTNSDISECSVELDKTKLSLDEVNNKLDLNSIEKLSELDFKIKTIYSLLQDEHINFNALTKDLSLKENERSILNHDLKSILSNEKEIVVIESKLKDLLEEKEILEAVVEGFSATGIPNLIIHTILNDLQEEANDILKQIKPGLQLSFVVEKENEDDTLDIKYSYHGKDRDFDLLSGAMKLSVNFAIKLGLSKIFQNILNIHTKFLLLDELDQSLDKASIDAFADIIKFFQKEFIVMVITHNDRMKDKFKTILSVEQDYNMISRVKTL